MLTRTLNLTIAVLVALAPLAALAQDAPAQAPRRTVLRVDGADVWVDVGTADGAAPGSQLRLHDVVTATHPVTGKKVRDSFEVGWLRIVVAGKKLSVARAVDAKALKRVNVGDEVTLGSAKVAVVDPWDAGERGGGGGGGSGGGGGKNGPEGPATPARPDGPVRPGDGDPAAASAKQRAAAQALVDEERALHAAWDATLGKPAEERIAVWTAHLATWPDGRHSPAVRAEIGSLKAQIEADKRLQLERAAADQRDEERGWTAGLAEEDIVIAGPLAFTPPRRVYEGSSFELSVLAIEPGSVKSAWVHVRAAGEQTYSRVAMTVEPGGALRARVPGDDVRPPRVEYFVEVLHEGGSVPANAIGSPEQPVFVQVDRSVEEPPRDLQQRSRVTMFVDYVDFDGGLAGGHDQYVHFEADFMYRFRGPVYAMRLGFATMSGEGGPKEAIALGECDTGNPDADPCRRVAFNYSYIELEFKLSELVAVMVRPMLGGGFRTLNDDEPAFDEFRSSFGLRGRLRLGREEETNLALGVGVISGFGTLFEAAFTWDVVPRFPIVLSTQVTDQPVADNFGVRLIADVGWRGTTWVYPSVRLAYQARNIDLSGISAGLAVNFDW